MRANLDGVQCAVVFCLMMVSAVVYCAFDTFITFFHVESLLDLITKVVCTFFPRFITGIFQKIKTVFSFGKKEKALDFFKKLC